MLAALESKLIEMVTTFLKATYKLETENMNLKQTKNKENIKTRRI